MSALTPDPAHALSASGNLARRQLISRIFVSGTVLACGLAVVVLAILILYCAVNGASKLSFAFLFGGAPGIGPDIVGTAELALIAVLIALPIGVLTALALAEFASARLARAFQVALELMAGLPPVLLGVFVVILIVKHWHQSALAGGVAMALLEMPLIAATTLQALRSVPEPMRNGAEALGVARWRTIVGLVLPAVSGAILTATILATARAAGDAALVIFTAGPDFAASSVQIDPTQGIPNLAQHLFTLLDTGQAAAAWSAAFVLMVIILAANIAARVLLTRNNRKLGL
ncbi:MAG: ABC transporter permease subunit [Solirubrobacterales bacterium]|nr:ABC transporter permease subunit [Solirubrobacterales bacterium]